MLQLTGMAADATAELEFWREHRCDPQFTAFAAHLRSKASLDAIRRYERARGFPFPGLLAPESLTEPHSGRI